MLQTFGRTPLTSISPKKTWEGTIVGLVGCIAITIVLSKYLSWPQSLFRYLEISFRSIETRFFVISLFLN